MYSLPPFPLFLSALVLYSSTFAPLCCYHWRLCLVVVASNRSKSRLLPSSAHSIEKLFYFFPAHYHQFYCYGFEIW
jgi:hypothetical protein